MSNVPGIKAAHRYLNYSFCTNCCKFQVRRLSLTLSLVNNLFFFCCISYDLDCNLFAVSFIDFSYL